MKDKQAEKKLTLVDEKKFKAEVWLRDKGHCRKCGRKVIKQQLSRVPNRGEVHHIHGRVGDLRFEARAALLLCLSCHEEVTGRVAERWSILGTKFWSLPGWTKLIDANTPVRFERVA